MAIFSVFTATMNIFARLCLNRHVYVAFFQIIQEIVQMIQYKQQTLSEPTCHTLKVGLEDRVKHFASKMPEFAALPPKDQVRRLKTLENGLQMSSN